MLSFPTREIIAGAIQVEGELSRDDPIWMASDQRPAGPVQVTGRLSPAGPGRFYFSGRLQGETVIECRRCLAEVRMAIDDEAHYVYGDAAHGGADDADTFALSRGRGGDEVDLRAAVREQWLLDTPTLALCRPDCRGLCPTCGADLNAGAHECRAAAPDPRREKLRSLGTSSRR